MSSSLATLPIVCSCWRSPALHILRMLCRAGGRIIPGTHRDDHIAGATSSRRKPQQRIALGDEGAFSESVASMEDESSAAQRAGPTTTRPPDRGSAGGKIVKVGSGEGDGRERGWRFHDALQASPHLPLPPLPRIMPALPGARTSRLRQMLADRSNRPQRRSMLESSAARRGVRAAKKMSASRAQSSQHRRIAGRLPRLTVWHAELRAHMRTALARQPGPQRPSPVYYFFIPRGLRPPPLTRALPCALHLRGGLPALGRRRGVAPRGVALHEGLLIARAVLDDPCRRSVSD